MKPAWSRTKLRVAFGPIPEPGTELRTPRGRRYQVIRVGFAVDACAEVALAGVGCVAGVVLG